ncbi:alpha/beta-hydrolase [Thozetella sp. PMI_491]|nr:alpha/beta-hydrolase [Thozetella sp. PMI_491]
MSAISDIAMLLVHGAWHGSWCWKDQIPALKARGYSTIETVDMACTSGKVGTKQFDDEASIRADIEPLLAAGKRVVVVGHSYGGQIAGAARVSNGEVGGVVGLVVLCGYIVPGGMDQGAVIEAMGGLPYVDWDTPSPGFFFPKDAAGFFYPKDGDMNEEQTAWALPQLRPQSSATNLGIVPPQAWQDPKYAGGFVYIRCTDDKIITIGKQDGMVASAGGEGEWIIRTLEGLGHLPQLSRPQDVATAFDEIMKEFIKQ